MEQYLKGYTDELTFRLKAMTSMLENNMDKRYLLIWLNSIIQLKGKIDSLQKSQQNDTNGFLQMQQELESRRYEYRDYYENAPLGYFVLNKEGIIMEVNNAGALLLGQDKIELIGTHFLLFTSEGNHQLFLKHCIEIFSKGTRQKCELQMNKSNGDLVYVELESIPIPNKQGKLEQFRIIMTDISNIKAMEFALKNKFLGKDMPKETINRRLIWRNKKRRGETAFFEKEKPIDVTTIH